MNDDGLATSNVARPTHSGGRHETIEDMTRGKSVPAERREGPLILWIVPLVAAIATPALIWVVIEAPMAIRFELGYAITAGVALVAMVILTVLSRGFRHRLRWAMSITTVAILTIFQWPTITYAGRIAQQALHLPLLKDGFPVLIAVALLWLATRNGDQWQFPAIVGAGVLAVVLALTLATIPYVELASASPRGTADGGAPDVLLLILDGYTRADIFEEYLDADNGAFLDDLERLGFIVPDGARPNYSFTYASISTMLNLDYVFDVGRIDDSDFAAMRHALSGNPEMFKLFHEAGYEVAFAENAWEGSHCGGAVDICIRDGFLQRLTWNLGQTTILAPILAQLQSHPFSSVSMKQLEALPSYLAEGRTEGVPRLTLAHIILPHAPYLFDADCNRVTSAERRAFNVSNEEAQQRRPQYYVDQAMCTNRKVVEALEEIIADKPDTVIMITADHGSAFHAVADDNPNESPVEGIRERMSILSAYRLPACDTDVYATISPVNGTRLVTNCATESSLRLLPDHTYWVPPLGHGTVVSDVGGRLGE